ncbi:MAG TPA: SMC family ATPase [Paenisporosarcina sp.]|nr:SMC family ATPase [Paenisporosarcina sp.]
MGRNRNNPRESNAVGKTTIFRAIEYVLFGKATVNLEKIVRHGCDRCKVTFEFESGAQQYRVSRSRVKKSGKSELRMYQKVGDDWGDITQKTATETEVELSKIVKISHVAFRSSILFAQADLHGLASVTPAERKAMLKEPLQISVYNKYEKTAKEKTASILKAVEKLKIQIETLGNPSADLTELSSFMEAAVSDLSSSEQALVLFQKQLDERRLLLADLEKINGTDIDTLRRQLLTIQQNIAQAKTKILSMQSAMKSNQAQSDKLMQETASTKILILKLEADRNVLVGQTLRSRVEVKDDIKKITNKEVEGRAYITKLQMDQARLQRHIPDGDACDHCLQPVSAEHRETCETKRLEELQATTINFVKYKGLLDTVRAKRVALENELNSIEQQEVELTSLDSRLATKRSEIEQNGKLIKQLAETIETRQTELAGYLEVKLSLEEQEATLNKQILSQTQDTILEEIKKVVSNIQELETKVIEISAKISSCNVTIGMLQEKTKARQQDKLILEGQLSDLMVKEKEYSMRLKVQQAFGSSGIPTMIINTILDDLQIIANDLLSEVRPGIEVVFLVAKTRTDGQQEDTLDIVYRINGIEHEYEQISGAQKVSVTLCLKLALSLIIQHRIGVDIKFLILDEVDSQFDDVSLDAFIDVIKKWQDKFTIFVVTHNPVLKRRFKHVIVVEGTGNGSTAKLVDDYVS